MARRTRPSHVKRKTYVTAQGKPFGSHRGPKTAIGPTSWRNLPIRQKKGMPMVGSGGGGRQIAAMAPGPPTVKRSGPVIY